MIERSEQEQRVIACAAAIVETLQEQEVTFAEGLAALSEVIGQKAMRESAEMGERASYVAALVVGTARVMHSPIEQLVAHIEAIAAHLPPGIQGECQ